MKTVSSRLFPHINLCLPRSHTDQDQAKREINEDEAKWVRQIFEWFAAGNSPKAIAHKLNQLQVPSTRNSTWAASAIYGDCSDGTGLLNNQLYVGRYIWNRSEWRKDPDTGKRSRTKREEREWIITDMPELRIISQPLWDAVQQRLHEIKGKSVAIRQALNNPNSRSRAGKYLFSGLIQCGGCGANYTIHSTTSYGCATNLNRGDAACSNRLRLPRKVLEGNLLDVIKKDLLTDEAIDTFAREAAFVLREKQSVGKPDYKAYEKAAKRAEKEIANIMAAIRAGIVTPTTKAELERAEADYKAAEAQLKAHTGINEILATALPQATERYKAMVAGLGKALATDIAYARQCLKGLLGYIRLVPSLNGKGLEAELRHNVDGLMKIALGDAFKARLVAGAGFEPAAFRL